MTDAGPLTAPTQTCPGERGDKLEGILVGQGGGEHRGPRSVVRLHAAAALEDDAHGLGQVQRAGDVGRGDFADAVADAGGGLDPPERQSVARAIWMAKMAGCVMAVSSIREAASSRCNSSRSDQSARNGWRRTPRFSRG